MKTIGRAGKSGKPNTTLANGKQRIQFRISDRHAKALTAMAREAGAKSINDLAMKLVTDVLDDDALAHGVTLS